MTLIKTALGILAALLAVLLFSVLCSAGINLLHENYGNTGMFIGISMFLIFISFVAAAAIIKLTK